MPKTQGRRTAKGGKRIYLRKKAQTQKRVNSFDFWYYKKGPDGKSKADIEVESHRKLEKARKPKKAQKLRIRMKKGGMF